MNRILVFILAFLLIIPVNLSWGQSDEGYGETETALGQFVDSFETSGNISTNVDVIRNSTLEAMELNGSSGIRDYENYTTFTEIDEDGDITVTDLTITFDSLRRDAISRVQYDYGANFFDEFQHEQDVNITDVEAGDASTRSHPLIWCVANVLGAYVGVVSASDSIGIWCQQNGAVDDQYQLQITWREAGVLQGQDIGITRNVNEAVYLIINRTDDDFWVQVYSDSSRSTLNETLNLDNISNTQFRYFYGLLGIGSANDPADHISGVIENLWFGNFTGGFETEGYFTTVDYLNDPLANGSALVAMVNTSIPANTDIQLQFSNDTTVWTDQEGVPGDSFDLLGGFESIDLRDLNHSNAIHYRFNLSTSDISITPRVWQSRLITMIGQGGTPGGPNLLNGTWVDHNLTEIGVTVGTLDSGNLASTNFIDGNMYNVSEVAGVPGMQISANITGIDDNAISLWITIYCLYDGNLNHDFDIEVWNFTGSAWVEDEHIEDGVALEWVNSTIYGLRIPNEFLNSGEVRVRLDHESAGNINHDLFIDYFRVQAFVPTGLAVAGAGANWGLLWFFLILICVPIALILLKGSKR